ncbi:hypothetical protein SLS62_007523 [Diatrype stigma]|uniref:Uncharacterized protein n=1 Tax=Diatrype stigma TaxID=117547 RepID=A0AAN9UNR4_9PEZI
MPRIIIMRRALKKLRGLALANTPINLSNDVYYALVEGDISKPDQPVNQVALNLSNRLAILLKTCTFNGDVYRRLLGGKPFWIFLIGAWNPLHPVTPEEVQHLVALVLEARRRFTATHQGGGTDDLTKAADDLIRLVDEVQSQGPHQQLASLRGTPTAAAITAAAAAAAAQQVPSVWPPEYLTGTDIALMAIKGVREKVFGLTNTGQSQGQSLGPPAAELPTRVDDPLALRAYLARVALTTPAPKPADGNDNGNGNGPVALYVAPVSFLDRQERVAWYKTTGHKSRLCATVGEFLEYALEVLTIPRRNSGNKGKEHAACLLAPWFFEPAAAAELANEHDVAIPTTWAREMPHAGMVLVVTRLAKRVRGTECKYRVVLFTPGLPRYEAAAEPTEERRKKKDAWVEGMLDAVDGVFDVKEGHIGGYTLRRYGGGSGDGEGKGKGKGKETEAEQAIPDSVGLASQFIWELAHDPERAVPEGMGLVERGFATIERWVKHGK